MDENQFDHNLIPDQFSLESILAEYAEDKPSAYRTEVEKSSHAIVVEAIGEVISSGALEVDEPLYAPEETLSDIGEIVTEESSPSFSEEFFGESTEFETYASSDFPSYGDDDTVRMETQGESNDTPKKEKREAKPRKKTFSETVMSPIIGILASVMEKERQLNEMELDPAEVVVEPEMAHEKAVKLYRRQVHSLRFRCTAAIAMCLVLSYISFAFTGFLPLGGALGSSSATASLVCFIILLTIMLAGLDVFTNGVLTLISGRPSFESLVSISCVFSIIDALMSASGNSSIGLPLCTISAWSLSFAMISNLSVCTSMLASLRVILAASEMPSAITTEQGIVNNASCVVKTRLPIDNFMRRSESADITEIYYTIASPFMLVAAFVLSLVVSLKYGASGFVHVFSAMTAACASFAGILAFSLPYAASANTLKKHGAAIAGFEGCADVGTAARFVVLDRDIFPPETISIDSIEIMQNQNRNKVIEFTASLIIASGCALAPAFTALMKKHNCVLLQTESFEAHEGGGILALVNNERVLVGSSSFMSLMGIRLPIGITTKNAVFTVINGELAGIFDVQYKQSREGRRAMEILLRDYSFPIFAVRDFNINPMMICQKFKVVTNDFEFPTFKERYRISAIENAENSPVSAITTKHGLDVMMRTADNARRLYKSSRILVIFSLISIAISMGIVLLMCGGDAISASLAPALLSFMFLCLAPVLVISYKFR